MNPPDAWQRLAAAARRLPDDRDLSAPYGFAARVAAQALAAEAQPVPFLAQFSLRLSLRAMGVACALAVLSAGVSYPTLVRLFSDGGVPAVAVAPAQPAVSLESVDAPAPAATAIDAATSPATDDPVAELVGIVS
jgi:hypothetical protein